MGSVMRAGRGILKKINARCHVAVAVIFLAGMLTGCGDNNSAGNQKTSATDVNNKTVLSNDAGAAGYPFAMGQKAETIQNNDSGFSQWTASAQTGDSASSSTASHGSAVSGVEKVSSPFGPFPTEPDMVSQQSDPDTVVPPPEPPETPRSPFGPFPTSQ